MAKLTEIAQARGWRIVATFTDSGISGAKGRKDRPGLDEMLKQAQRGTFDVVMAWAIDRVGRSLIDLLGTIQHLEACKVVKAMPAFKVIPNQILSVLHAPSHNNITGIAGCCARAASGHVTTVPPMRVMKSRRLMPCP